MPDDLNAVADRLEPPPEGASSEDRFSQWIRSAAHVNSAERRARDHRQAAATAWAREAFGDAHVRSVEARVVRFLEEAIELAQAAVALQPDASMMVRAGVKAHDLITRIFALPPGEVGQEIGGVMNTLNILASTMGKSVAEEEETELNRVARKSPAHFRARNQVKLDAGF